MAGELPAWKARQIAAETLPLNAAAAGYVDAHLAPFAHEDVPAAGSCGACTPRSSATTGPWPPNGPRRPPRAAGSGSTTTCDGTSRITAVTTTPDAAAFEHAVDQVAGDLAALGSTAPDQVRRATAVGVLADPQHALDLHTTADQPPPAKQPPSSGAGRGAPSRARRSTSTCTPTPSTASLRRTDRRHRARGPGPRQGTPGHRGDPAVADRPRPGHPDHRHPGRRPDRAHLRGRLRDPRPAPQPGHRTRRRLPVPLVRPPRASSTSTTSTPTSTPTTADHPARPTPPTPPGCAGSTTG